jgi:N4-gp56 family major capsid protein
MPSPFVTTNAVPSGHPNHPGDISFRTAGHIARELLKRAQPLMIISRLGQPKPIPKNVSDTIKFRGYQHLDNQPKELMEGITPDASKPTYREVHAQLKQYGDWIGISDKIDDTHEDPLIAEFSGILGEQSAIMLERVMIEILHGATNVFFSGDVGGGVNATSRSEVNKPINLNLQRRIMRGLRRQLAQPITNIIAASPNFNTSPIPPSYIAVAHTDCQDDIREMPGFIPAEKYGSYKPMEGEFGSVEGVRYMTTTLLDPFIGAGAAPLAGTPILASGACADVYPIYFFGKDAFGVTPYAKDKAGASPVMPMILNPNVPRGGDPLGQRGSMGWKAYRTGVILYDFWMCRAEVAVSQL